MKLDKSKTYRRKPVEELFVRWDERIGSWIAYGGAGHGAFGGQITEEKARDLLSKNEWSEHHEGRP